MKTKKSIWSIALILVLALALVLGLGFGASRAAVKADPIEDIEHITFDVTVDDHESIVIGRNYDGYIVVRYTVAENTGVDALQLQLGYDHDVFQLTRLEVLNNTALGAATVTNGTLDENNVVENYDSYIYENNIDANIVFDNTNTNGTTYTETDDVLIVAYFARIATTPGVYNFGFADKNNKDNENKYYGFSNAWRIEPADEAEETTTHAHVELRERVATVIIRGDYEFTLTGGEKVYDGAAGTVTLNDNDNAHRPEISYVWFVDRGNGGYEKLNAAPVNVGTYKVVIEYAANDYYDAYVGYTETTEGSGLYNLDSNSDHVVTFTINQKALNLAFDARSEQYKTFTNSTFDGYLAGEGYLTVTGIVGNDNVSVSLDATNILNAGVGQYDYAVSGNDVILVSLNGTDVANYKVGTITGKFTITQKTIVLGTDVTFNGGNFVWNGSERTISVNFGNYGDVLTASYAGGQDGCANNGAIAVGKYTITATISLNNNNYVLSGTNPLTAQLQITAISLTQEQVNTLVANNAIFYAVDNSSENVLIIANHLGSYTKTYDAHNAYIGVVLGNVEGLSNAVLYSIDGSAAVSKTAVLSSFNTEAYNKVNAGTYTVVITFQPATGYAFEDGVNADYTITLTINRKALTINATASATYNDAAATKSVDNGTGWVANENYATYNNTTVDAIKAYVSTNYAQGKNAGTAIVVEWNEGAEAAIENILTNYNVTLTAQNGVIAKKVVNANDYAFEGYTGTYNGASHNLTVTGTVDTQLDLVEATFASKSAVINVADTGTYTATITLNSNYTFENGTAGNWTVAEGYASASKTAQVTITPKALTINIAYTKTTATFTLSGFVGGETEAVLTNLVYEANQEQSYCISGNVFTVDNEVYNTVTISATSGNTNYTIIDNQLRKIIIVGYLAGPYDANISGETPDLPSDDVFFAGFTTVQPQPVALNHYTFKCFSTDSAGNNPFDYAAVVNESTAIYVTWDIKGKVKLTLYYMVDGDAENAVLISENQYFVDEPINYDAELNVLTAKSWFKIQNWFTNDTLEAEYKFVDGATINANTALYANYKFNIGIGDVNANGTINANDVTLYRQWIVGGYTMNVVEVGNEWTTVNSENFNTNNTYFVKRVADSNAATAISTTLGDDHLDIRDVSTIRMGLVGGYGFSIMEGKYVDGHELIIVRTIALDNASDLLIVAKSGVEVQLAGNIEEEDFIGAIENCTNDVVIDLNGKILTLKSLRIALANGNTGKIEIKNGTIHVADGNGVSLVAPNGSVILNGVTLFDENGQFELQAANHSLHLQGNVQFLKAGNAAAEVKIEKDTHVVVEEQAVVTVAKIVVTENFVPSTEADVEITITIRNDEQQNPIVIDGNHTNEIVTLADLVAAAQKGGEYTLAADLAYTGRVTFTQDTVLNLNGHSLRSTNDVALGVTNGAKLTINGNGNVIAQEACVMAFNASEIEINGGTFTAIDNFVVGTNGSTGAGGNTITINGGVFNGNIQTAGYVACGIYVANNDTVEVNAGTFNVTNGVGILARSGNTTVAEGVTFNVTGNGALGKVGDSKVTVPAGAVLVIDLAAGYPGGTPVLVNNTEYDICGTVKTLANINAIKNAVDEIVLEADITTNAQAPIYFGYDIVLNLNGHTVRSTDDVALRAVNGAKLTINGNGNVIAQEACVMAFDASEIVIENGTFTAYDNFVVGTNGTAGRGGNTITINGGTFNGGIQSNGYIACGIYVANNDTVVVNAGTFNVTNGVGILARSGSTTVGANVVFNMLGENELVGKVGDASKPALKAGKVLILDLAAGYPGGEPTLTNNTNYRVCAVVDSVADIYTARNIVDEIILAANITTNDQAPIMFGKDIVLNLNGYTVRSTNDVALRVLNGAKLTINGNGNVIAQEACVMAFDASEIVIEDGTFTAIDNFVVGTNGTAGRGGNTITINGGTFNGNIQTAGYVACGIYVANNDTVVVNGGTFNITNGVGILARCGNTTVNAGVTFNMLGENTLVGKVGDSRVVIPAGEALVLDNVAGYPAGAPTLVNNTQYEVYDVQAQ